MRILYGLSSIIAVLAVLAPAAHVLEMANKFQLDGPLWLAVQQHLYRGWGPLVGAPTEIGGLLVNSVLFCLASQRSASRRLAAVAVLAYVGMLVSFWALNAPVNAAISNWTAADLPPDWPDYRLRWEIGHALAALLAAVALIAVLRRRGLDV